MHGAVSTTLVLQAGEHLGKVFSRIFLQVHCSVVLLRNFLLEIHYLELHTWAADS